jgi:hypothetical protein
MFIVENRIARDGSLWIRLKDDDRWYHELDPKVHGATWDPGRAFSTTALNIDGISLVDFTYDAVVR